MAEANPTRTPRTRKSTGGVVEPTGQRKSWAIRFRAYGRRHTLTLGRTEDGWNRRRAEEELANVLADVRRGTWIPPEQRIAFKEPKTIPTFHRFATDWLDDHRATLRPRTVEDYEWALELHLLRFFGQTLVSAITIEDVDRYRREKKGEGRLSDNTVNKTITRLAQILEVAVEYGHLDRNPARGNRRRLPTRRPKRVWLEAMQVTPLLDAAGAIDAERTKRRSDDPGGRRALLATLALAGLRVGEALSLRWRDVDLASGRLTVAESKTDAGRRVVDLSPDLRSELAVHKASSDLNRPADFVFATRSGQPLNRNNVRTRILLAAVERANVAIEAEGELADVPLLPTNISPHGLRHTYCSLLLESGATVPYVMAQIGHSDPRVTLSIYAHVLERNTDAGKRLDALVRPSATDPRLTAGQVGESSPG